MSSAISREELETAFGAEHLVTVEPGRLNPVVTHEESARFLTGAGLPDVDGFLFMIDDDLASGPASAAARKPWLADCEGAEGGIGDWVILGFFWDDVVLLDGATGAVRVLVDGTSAVVPVNAGVDLFARFLTLLRGELGAMALGDDVEDDAEHEAIGARLLERLRALDPAGFAAEESYWSDMVDSIVWGL